MVLLWKDVPQHSRVDRAYLTGCVGARTPGWVDGLVALAEAPACNAALPFNERFIPCKINLGWSRNGLCHMHGGNGKAVYAAWKKEQRAKKKALRELQQRGGRLDD